jgi:hypothetical protein
MVDRCSGLGSRIAGGSPDDSHSKAMNVLGLTPLGLLLASSGSGALAE